MHNKACSPSCSPCTAIASLSSPWCIIRRRKIFFSLLSNQFASDSLMFRNLKSSLEFNRQCDLHSRAIYSEPSPLRKQGIYEKAVAAAAVIRNLISCGNFLAFHKISSWLTNLINLCVQRGKKSSTKSAARFPAGIWLLSWVQAVPASQLFSTRFRAINRKALAVQFTWMEESETWVSFEVDKTTSNWIYWDMPHS